MIDLVAIKNQIKGLNIENLSDLDFSIQLEYLDYDPITSTNWDCHYYIVFLNSIYYDSKKEAENDATNLVAFIKSAYKTIAELTSEIERLKHAED